MAKQVNIESLSALSPDMDKFHAFEREVIGGIYREIDQRKEKAEIARVNREKKAKKKRQRAAAASA
jgi:hypothetical protein